jgi:hypothetical protein
MATLARILLRTFPRTEWDNAVLKQIMLFCAAGLLVSLLLLSYGLDLSPGFF